MIGKHASFGHYPWNQRQIVLAISSFEGALGFRCMNRSDLMIEYVRHQWFKDRMLIEIGEEQQINGATYTQVVMSMALHPLRHPFSGGKPSIEVTLLASAITEHVNSLLGPARAEASQA